MKRLRTYFTKHKVASRILIGFLALLIIIILIIRFSPPILITLPLGKSFIQVKIHKGFDAFFPKNTNSLYYFHNSLIPQTITDANTSYKGKESLSYFQIWWPKLPTFSLPTFPMLKQPPPQNRSNQISSTAPSPKNDRITSQEINLTFIIPPNYDLRYEPKSQFDYREIINIDNGPSSKKNWMSIQIYSSDKCDGELNNGSLFPGKTINIASKWPMVINKSHGRYGSRDQQGIACLDNNKTIHMFRYVQDDGSQVEMEFDKILETAVYRP